MVDIRMNDLLILLLILIMDIWIKRRINSGQAFPLRSSNSKVA